MARRLSPLVADLAQNRWRRQIWRLNPGPCPPFPQHPAMDPSTPRLGCSENPEVEGTERPIATAKCSHSKRCSENPEVEGTESWLDTRKDSMGR